MAIIDDVKTAYRAVLRTTLSDSAASSVAASITGGSTTLNAYITQLIAAANTSTVPGVAFAAFFDGVVPTSDRLDLLTTFASNQFASYTALGVGNPALGPFEAIGRGFAADPTTKAAFNTKYGSGTDASFLVNAYLQVYNVAPPAAAQANLQSQLTYFTNLYLKPASQGGAGLSATDAALQARGAVLGQILGYAFTDPASSAIATIDNQVTTLLQQLATGSTSGYGQPLPAASGSGGPGAILTLTAANNVIDPSASDLSLKSTSGDDTIRGLLAGHWGNGDVINGAGGIDTLSAVVAASTTLTPVLTSVEKIFVNTPGVGATAPTINLSSATGVTEFWSATNDANNQLVNLTAATKAITLGIKTSSTNFSADLNATFTDTGGTSDTVKVALDGGGSTAFSTITTNGVETIQAQLISKTNARFVDPSLKQITVAGTGDLSLQATAANLERVDASGVSGVVTFTFTTQKDINVSTGSGNDLIIINATTTEKATISAGGGNDVIWGTENADTIDAGDGNDLVRGLGGADVITLGPGNDVARYADPAYSTISSLDTITDFKQSGADVIDIFYKDGATSFVYFTATNAITAQNAVDALAPGATLTQAVTAAEGAGIGTGRVGSFKFNGDTYVVANLTANAVGADMVIKLNGTPSLSASDFIFL